MKRLAEFVDLFILDQRVRSCMTRRRPNLKRASSPRPSCNKINPKTQAQETAAEKIGNRILALAAGWRAGR